MKKILLSLFFVFSSLFLTAQEEMEKVDDTGKWSESTKLWVLGAFTAFILILVVRTFRNKPSA